VKNQSPSATRAAATIPTETPMIAIYDIDTDVGEFELVELELDATLPAVTVAITMTVSAEPGSNFEDESELGLDSKVEVKRKLKAEVDEGGCEIDQNAWVEKYNVMISMYHFQ
jgi:hypothetical protein